MILGCPVGFGIDIWSLGCLLFELLTGVPLFQLPPMGVSQEGVDDDHLIQLTDIIQPLPKDLITRWPRASKYYGPGGARLDTRPYQFTVSDGPDDEVAGWADGDDEEQDFADEAEDQDEYDEEESAVKPYDLLEEAFKANKPDDIGEEDEREIVSLLRWIFQIDPLKRPSANDLLEHPWIRA